MIIFDSLAPCLKGGEMYKLFVYGASDGTPDEFDTVSVEYKPPRACKVYTGGDDNPANKRYVEEHELEWISVEVRRCKFKHIMLILC